MGVRHKYQIGSLLFAILNSNISLSFRDSNFLRQVDDLKVLDNK